MSDKSTRSADFKALIHRIIVTEGKPDVESAARALGMSVDSLNARLYGRVAFDADEIRDLIRNTADRRIIDYLLAGSHFIAIQRSAPGVSPSVDAQQAATRTVIEAAQLLDQVEQALSDLKICHQDKAKILKEIHDVEVAVTSLRSKLDLTR